MRLPPTFTDWAKSILKYVAGFFVLGMLLQQPFSVAQVAGIALVLFVLFPALKKYLPHPLSRLSQKWLIIILSIVVVLALIPVI